MASLEKLLIEEKILRGRIEKIIENGKKTAIAKRNQGFFETRIADLKTVWAEYSAIDLAINKILLEVPKDKPHEYISEDRYSNTEFKYSEYMGELLDGLRKFTFSFEQSTISVNPNSTTTVINQDSVLPRIALPKFDGNYDLWHSFRDLFVSMVHDNNRLTPVQKLHHLKTCLVGDAEKLLRHIPITNEDYEPAWKKLKDRYENKKILVNHQLKILMNQPKINNESAKGIKMLINTTEECLQHLKSLKVDTTSWDVILIHLLVHKLPFATLKLWEEEQGGTQELPSFDNFMKFLQTRLQVLESIADALIPKANQSRSICTSRESTQALHIINKPKCPACSGNHFVQKCTKYQNMNLAAKRKVILSSGRCLNCLSRDHTVSSCTSKYRCSKCNARHHSTLHENQKEKLHNVNSPSNNPRQKAREELTQDIIQHSHEINSISSTPEKIETTQSFVVMENQHALLATALVIVQGEEGNSQILRCLIDTGSQASFITETAIKRLQVKPHPTTVQVKGVNATSAATSRQQVKLKLHSCKANELVI